MRHTTFALILLLCACGSSDDDPPGPDAGDGPDAIGSTDGPSAQPEPCDPADPTAVEVGVPVASPSPSETCTLSPGGAHFYRFTPPTDGVYSISKTGGSLLAFCPPGAPDGCACAFNSNCCADCDLTFDLVDGSPLPAGSNQVIYVITNDNPADYGFTVTGPQ